ncbi:hypothetical protein EMIT0P74_10297 [Pseudomonas sp. IT-P74]|uniref:hypothetical protein n=1 Tax=Pseudomonas sp. IT-P74 TaxID=3026445 RepID=UPI0039E00467
MTPPEKPAFWRNAVQCRSELARDGLKSAAFSQQIRVIVDDHREQARSYKESALAFSGGFFRFGVPSNMTYD